MTVPCRYGIKKNKINAVTDKLTDILSLLSPVPEPGTIDGSALLEAHRQPAVTSIRINPAKNAGLFSQEASVPWCNNGRYLTERPVFTLDPLFHAGAYYVQEASSMFVEHAFRSLVQREAPLRVLDLCAAPGGKSTLLASLLQADDLLISNEVIQNRAAVLAENLTRWGQMNTWVTQNDPRDYSNLHQYFDVILVDAPCTGSGLWRKDEEAIGEWSPDHVKLCSERQRRIIADVLPALKPGGVLLYATCSYSPEENEMIADWICDAFEAISLRIPTDAAWHIAETQSSQHKAYGYRFYPWKLQGEGFFLAAFRKQGPTGSIAEPERHNDKKGKQKGKERDKGRDKGKDEGRRWESWLDCAFATVERHEEYYAIHPEHKQDYEYLQTCLRIKKTGTALGKIAGKDIIPDHELALSVHLSASLPRVALNREEALQYLKKEEVRKDNTQKGWLVAAYENLGMGWGKWLPNRMNNYFPKNWRIRMDIK
jgi:16S rRNA C967 or C1407 C5-methylase (RsmB/RsmF family)/NOL1/NOP2/fmu family ribosome biogenesis protein